MKENLSIAERLDNSQKQVLKFIEKKQGMSPEEISSETGLEVDVVRNAVALNCPAATIFDHPFNRWVDFRMWIQLKSHPGKEFKRLRVGCQFEPFCITQRVNKNVQWTGCGDG